MGSDGGSDIADGGAPTTSLCLGVEQTPIGVPEQLLARRFEGVERGIADAHAQSGSVRPIEGSDDPVSQRAGTLEVRHRKDHGELVPADPGDGIDGSADPPDECPGVDEGCVSRGMAAGVVERLEEIDVDDEQAQGMTVPQGTVHLDAQLVVEDAVTQAPGERVNARLAVELLDEPVLVSFEP